MGRSLCKKIEGQVLLHEEIESQRRIETKNVNNMSIIEQKEQEAINIVSQTTQDEFIYTSEYLKENTTIRGWLSFFLFTVIVGGLISVGYPLLTFNLTEYDNNLILALADPLLGLILFLLACYVFYSFIKRKPNAVFLARMYVIAVLVSNLLSLLLGEYEQVGMGSVVQLVRSLIWSCIWLIFLSQSSNVEEVIPEEYRRVKRLDYFIAATLIIYPLLIFFATFFFSLITSKKNQQSILVQSFILAEDEYTDGRFAFTRPAGFTCKDTLIDGHKVFNMECESIGGITLCCDYENNRSEQNVKTYWRNWEDNEFKKYPFTIECSESKYVNRNAYYYFVKKYNVNDGELYWRFIMMFDPDSKKVCVVSCYDGGFEDYVEELLNSIRFK